MGERAIFRCPIDTLPSSCSHSPTPLELQPLESSLSAQLHNCSLYFQVLFSTVCHGGLFRIVLLQCIFLSCLLLYNGLKHLISYPSPCIICSHATHPETSSFFHPQVYLKQLPCVSHDTFPSCKPQLVLLATFLGSPTQSMLTPTCLIPEHSFLLCPPIKLSFSFRTPLKSQFCNRVSSIRPFTLISF